MKRIVFLVSVPKAGIGGHYHSLRVHAEVMQKAGYIVSIITLGYGRSPVIDGMAPSINRSHIFLKWPRGILPIGLIKRQIASYKADIIHAYDVHAYLFARIAASAFNMPVVLTKCGGGKPKTYFPKGNDLVVFSGEDAEFFQYKWKRIHLVPNRATMFDVDLNLTRKLLNRINHSYDIKLLRITRIGAYYEKTLHDTINLISELRERGVNACLIVIGAIYEHRVFQRLQALNAKHVYFFTDKEFTQNAKALLPSGDVVIGTGRSLMEAAVAGKPVLAPAQNLDVPVLVCLKNIQPFLHYNFSERTKVNTSREQAIKEIVSLADPNTLNHYKSESLEIAKKYFLASQTVDTYHQIYRNAEPTTKKEILSTAPHTIEYVYRLSKAWLRRKIES